MMLKIVVFGVLATAAFGQLSFGGMDLGGMLKSLPPGALEGVMKDMNPEKIHKIMENLPPQMSDMIKGMGFSKDMIEDMVNNMPKDMDVSQLLDKAKSAMTPKLDEVKDALKEQMEVAGMKGDISDIVPQMRDDLRKYVREEFDLDIDNLNKEEIAEKIREFAIQNLKDSGIEVDLENPQQTMVLLKNELKKMYNLPEEAGDEELKKIVGDELFGGMKEAGFDVDPEHPDESFGKIKDMVLSKAKEWGLDPSEGFDFATIKDKFVQRMKDNGVPIDEPHKMIGYVMMKAKEFMPLIQEFMAAAQPAVMPNGPVMAPGPQMPLTFNLEVNVDRDEAPVRSGISRDDAMELMQDMLYYRSVAKKLIVENERLHHKIEVLVSMDRPAMSTSPLMAALKGRF